MTIKTKTRVLLIVGVSGAGKTTVLHTLEDCGFRVVDGLPLSMIESFVAVGDSKRSIAIGVDTFTEDFSIKKIADVLLRLNKNPNIKAKILYLDCDDKTVMRRYKETRRTHPFAKGKVGLLEGISKERERLVGFDEAATNFIDTSELSAAELKHMTQKIFCLMADKGMLITVMSFAYRGGIPLDADLVFDVRCLVNPHYDAKLRSLTGLDKKIGNYIRKDADFGALMKALKNLLDILIPKYEQEGKSYLTIAVGCTGGRHRSVFVAEEVAKWLSKEGKEVVVRHREIGSK